MGVTKLLAVGLALTLTIGALPDVRAEKALAVDKVLTSRAEVTTNEEVAPESDFEYEVNEDGVSVTITKYKGNGGDVVIPSEIEGKKVTSIGRSAFANCISLTSVTIPDGVTSIGVYAFGGCDFLTSVAIPNSVTEISKSVFEGCASLTSATIPDSVTSIGGNAFLSCTSLASVIIPDKVTSIGSGAFSGCTSLTSVIIPDRVTDIGGGPFSGCTSLTAINVNEKNICYSSKDGVLFNKNKTELIQYPAGRTNESYEIPDSVTRILPYVFKDCASLTSVTIPDSVTDIYGYTFYGCTALTLITIPESITSIGFYAFNGCTSLTSVTIPYSVTSISDWVFGGCTSLTSVTVPDSVTNIGNGTFDSCPYLTLYGYEKSYAQKYAEKNRIPFKILGKEAEINEQTGIIIENPNLTGKTLEVETTSTTATEITYNIALKDEKGNEVQPAGDVTVKIPLPNGWIKASVSRKEADGTLKNMQAKVENGYIIFVTDHFSEYVLKQKPAVTLGDLNSDEKININDVKIALRGALNNNTLTDDQKTAADVNKDEKVNISDVKLILKAALNGGKL